MGIAGTADATRIDVHAESRGTTGVLQLTLRVPAGVTLDSASGDWRSCEQSGELITCTARSTTGRWSGTVVTSWADDAIGRVTAEVGTTYRSGGDVTAAATASWPP